MTPLAQRILCRIILFTVVVESPDASTFDVAYVMYPAFCSRMLVSKSSVIVPYGNPPISSSAFRKVILYGIIHTELSSDSAFICQQRGHLYIKFFTMLIANKINLFITRFANRYPVSTAEELHIYDVLKNPVDVPHIAAQDSLPDTIIRNIILLVSRKYLFSLQVFTLYLISFFIWYNR